MPWNQPFRNKSTNMTVIELMAQGDQPMKMVVRADNSRPTLKKVRALLRSDTLPIRNLLRP